MRHHSRRSVSIAVMALLGTLGGACGGPVEEETGPEALGTTTSALTEVTGFGTNPGALRMFTYVPTAMPTSAPVVVAIHGCQQSAAAFENAGWNQLAEKNKFYVIYPQQQSANNTSSCFNWFVAGDNARDQGEALSIKQMVDKVKATYSVDSTRVFVTGLSAGGAMAAVEMAAYPDVFAGGSIAAGIPYNCSSQSSALSCQMGQVDLAATQWGDFVRNAYPGYTGRRPRVMIWQGDSDKTVNVKNMTELMEQWTNVNGADQVADLSEVVRTHTHTVYKNAAGPSVVETYKMTGGAHALPVDPGTNVDQGGTVATYFNDYNLFSSYYAARFWGLVP
jgi:poly(hydroxyalkanoate) depolymerase family esterase